MAKQAPQLLKQEIESKPNINTKHIAPLKLKQPVSQKRKYTSEATKVPTTAQFKVPMIRPKISAQDSQKRQRRPPPSFVKNDGSKLTEIYLNNVIRYFYQCQRSTIRNAHENNHNQYLFAKYCQIGN